MSQGTGKPMEKTLCEAVAYSFHIQGVFMVTAG